MDDTVINHSWNGLDPHQADGVRWLLDHPYGPHGLLAWEMGVGKTAPIVRAWELTAAQGPLCVFCLASARENWRREVLKYALDQDWRPKVQAIFDSGDPIDPRADVVICNYTKLLNRFVAARFRSRKWGAMALDEAHVLKSVGAERTRIIYGNFDAPMGSGKHKQRPLIQSAGRVWLATGTPMPNHPGELYSHAATLWPERMQYQGHTMAQWEFEAAFCDVRPTQYGIQIVGARNTDELRERLDPVIHVLKRKDVLSLPPCYVTSWPLDFEYDCGERGRPVADLPDLLGTLTRKYGPPDDIERFDQATLDAYLTCIDQEMMALSSIRREISVLKAVLVGLTIDEELDGTNGKTVVFAHHREAIATVAKALARYKPAIIHGDVPAVQRQTEVDRFQMDPACRVFVGQLTAAGSSINLQAADNVVFVEASWSPGDNDQALSRVYRRGQERPVTVRFAFLPGTIDEAVQRALARKAAMIAAVL